MNVVSASRMDSGPGIFAIDSSVVDTLVVNYPTQPGLRLFEGIETLLWQ